MNDFEINYVAYKDVENIQCFSGYESVLEYRKHRLKEQNGLVKFITNYIDSELSVIDVGSGSSALLYAIYDLGILCEGVGIEFSSARHKFAELWKRDKNIHSITNINDDFSNVLLPQNSCNLFLCVDNTFSYLMPENDLYPNMLITKAFNSLVDDGVAILEMHNYSRIIDIINRDKYCYFWKENVLDRFVFSLYKYGYHGDGKFISTDSVYLDNLDSGVTRKNEISYPWTVDEIRSLVSGKFDIVSVCSDYECNEFDESSSDMIFVLKKRKNNGQSQEIIDI